MLAQNALLVQSRADLRGVSHSDGWGIGFYPDGKPDLVRRHTAAHADIFFSTTVERVFAKTVVAHVRRATVGGASLENTHPFSWENWTFAHNGTITGFDRIRRDLESETLSDLRKHRRGSTDSEAAFYWMLSRLAMAGFDLGKPLADLERARRVVGENARALSELCFRVEPQKTPRLNFLLTDGNSLIVTRWNNSLFLVKRKGVHDCEICGIPHIHHDQSREYRAVVIASEPITHEKWLEVQERSVLSVDSEIGLVRQEI